MKTLDEIDCVKLGLKCGIEIHQQINSKHKLFSKAKSTLIKNENLDKQIIRKLRFSSGENNEIDKSALEEFKKGKYNIYKYNNEISTLYELDEIPPRNINEEVLNEVLKISKHLELKFFDKIQIMRKLIIDGSCVSGFQRTSLIGLNGKIEIEEDWK